MLLLLLERTTLGPAQNEFGYNEHPAIMNIFSLQKEHFSLTSMLKKFDYNEYLL